MTEASSTPVCLCCCDVGLAEVCSLEQQRFAARLGESISEAVSEIQPGWMATFSEIKKSLAREMSMFYAHRFNRNLRATKKRVALPTRIGTDLAFDHHREFDKICGADSTSLRIVDRLNEASCLRLAE